MWIPACAGMTTSDGMTTGAAMTTVAGLTASAGMTTFAGKTNDRNGPRADCDFHFLHLLQERAGCTSVPVLRSGVNRLCVTPAPVS